MYRAERFHIARSFGALLAAVVLLAAGCAPASQPAAKPAASSAPPQASPATQQNPTVAQASAPASQASPVATRPAAAPPDKLKLVYGNPVTPPSMVHLPAYVANRLGFFDEVGLEVEFKSFEGGVSALRGGISGGLDVIGTSSDPLFAAIQAGAPIKAIGTYAPKLSVVITTAPDIHTVADLKGRRIGIQDVGGFNEVMARLLLQSAGLTQRDVQYVSIATANRVPALINGQVDATVLHIDQYYAAISQKPDLVNLAQMWEVVPDWWYSAFVSNETTIREKREALVRFLTAVIKAQRTLYLDPQAVKPIAVEETRRKPEEVERAYEDLVRGGVWNVNDGMPRHMIEYTVEKEAEVGIIKPENKPTYEQIVERSLVDEAVRRNGGPWTGDPRWY
ncbi:MAG TPA: ABC transporter substrate-binding protein [Chloroflexota bacterium]|nr:ABC transporter substrate-binding protein [Chloroflexota bacterium]